jgi:hypothetical protein
MNAQTDRLFLASEDGTIQCVRPIGREHPTFHIPVSEGITGGTLKAQRLGDTTTNTAAATDANDPFAEADSSDAPPVAADEDPFTAAEYVYENPFLTESTEGGDVNPFEIDSGSGSEGTTPPTGEEAPAETDTPPPAAPKDDADPFGG